MIEGTRCVVDASVAVKWYLPEPGSVQAAALLRGHPQLIAPDLLTAELGNTLWKRTRRGDLTAREASRVVEAFVSSRPITLWSSESLLRGAWQIASDLGQTVYDALYLALAVAEDCRFVTADDRLVRALRSTTLGPFVRALTET